MSHKAGIAQPLISNKTIIIALAVCFSIIALTILHSLNDEKQNSKKEEGGKEKVPTAYGIPKSPETVLYFQKGQRGVTVNLRTDQWSRVISTPTDPVRHVDYCIDVNPPIGFYVLFGDGRIEDVRADQKEVTNVGFCRGVFRLLGKSSDQTAVITISYR